MTSRIFTADDLATFTEIAGLIGDGWTVEQPYERTVSLVHDGRVIWLYQLHTGSGPARYSLRGVLPDRNAWFTREEEASGLRADHEITVAASKTAKQIAGDIKRRLLPDYERSYVVVAERVAERDAGKARKAADLAELAAVAPGVADVATDRDGDAERVTVRYQGSAVYGDFKSITWRGTTEYTVKLENVTPELAAKILALVAESRN